MALLSPGFETKESSTQNTIIRGATGRAAMAGKFSWGPVNKITQLTNEVELKDLFGTPDDLTADYFISGANFLQVGNDLRLVRVVDEENAKNSSPLANTVLYSIGAGGTGYKVNDPITIELNDEELKTKGHVSEVDSDGRLQAVFIPNDGLIQLAKSTGTYPNIEGNIKVSIESETGLQGTVTLTGFETDSGILINNPELAEDILEESEFKTKMASLGLPLVAAVYPGELGNTLSVEIQSFDSFHNAKTKEFPSGLEVASSANSVLQYGPQDETQYAIIVRKSGVVVERFVLSTKPGTKDMYNKNIFMDDFFKNGGSSYIYMSTENFPKGFSGIIKLDGGTSSNHTTSAGDLMRGWDFFADSETIHVNLLIAGSCAGEPIDVASTVQKHAAYIADQRKDCVAYITPPKDLLVNIPLTRAIDNLEEWKLGKKIGSAEIVDDNMNYSTTYAFCDANYKYQYDKYNDVYRWVPLAADIAGRAAHTANVANVWDSIAGLNRGIIPNAAKLAIEPRRSHRDRLYAIGMNPVFGIEGSYVLFGDKTMTMVPSPFDRINVRNLFNKLKYEIGGTSKYKLFENNTTFTRNSFRTEVSNYLANIKALGGIIDFRVICDSTNNTQAVIDRNEFIAQIYIKPPRSINYITLEFIASESGADFDELIGPATLDI